LLVGETKSGDVFSNRLAQYQLQRRRSGRNIRVAEENEEEGGSELEKGD
jgi:hypothetical protein